MTNNNASTQTDAMPSRPCATSLPQTISAYPTLKNIFNLFSPDKQPVYCQLHERCVTGTALTLRQLDLQFPSTTERASWLWLIPQLEDLTTFCGAREKMAPTQYRQLAAIIATQYHWLKLTDIMLFCWRFKQGSYGKFYGTIDPIVITTALHTYTRERAVIIENAEQRKRDAHYENARKNAVPCPLDTCHAISSLLKAANNQHP